MKWVLLAILLLLIGCSGCANYHQTVVIYAEAGAQAEACLADARVNARVEYRLDAPAKNQIARR